MLTSHGGKETGSTTDAHIIDTAVVNYFYLFKDKELATELTLKAKKNSQSLNLIQKVYLQATTIPQSGFTRYHSFLSGYNTATSFLPATESSTAVSLLLAKESITPLKRMKKIVGIVGGILNLAITPPLRFRFSRIDPSRLEDDTRYGGFAYRTTQKVEAWRIGILGSLLTGINRDWLSRVREYPIQVLTGAVQLACGVGLGVLATRCNAITSPIIASAVLGAIMA